MIINRGEIWREENGNKARAPDRHRALRRKKGERPLECPEANELWHPIRKRQLSSGEADASMRKGSQTELQTFLELLVKGLFREEKAATCELA